MRHLLKAHVKITVPTLLTFILSGCSNNHFPYSNARGYIQKRELPSLILNNKKDLSKAYLKKVENKKINVVKSEKT